ncbi:hypothetical protein KC726_00820 [Candidatus Woesebacteria bacterium]|nr:hypothetical protein [Candidatus Woesebacteria bacterium]
MSSLTFHKLSWGQLEKDCLLLYPKIKDLQIDRLVSISRGGNVVSRIVSDLLGSLPISHITITSYEHTKKLRTPIITEEPTVSFKDMTTLIVDEVSDTGDTFHIAEKYFKKKNVKKIFTLAPYIKPHTHFKPDFWTKSIDAWIVFPYDIRETADGFVKMFGSKGPARRKLLEIGFEEWELKGIV